MQLGENMYLHSTMYLLNPLCEECSLCTGYDLHSTMYLLNRSVVTTVLDTIAFTFHYVSIKSPLHQTQRA